MVWGIEEVEPITVPWWDENFSHRVKLNFNSRSLDQDLLDVPVMIEVENQSVFGSAVAADGSDIRFVAVADGGDIELDHEIETWEPEATSVLWVRVPKLTASSADDFIYLYFGNPRASNSQNPSGVWATGDFLAVYHLSDALAGEERRVTNSVQNQFHGTANDMDESNRAAGMMGGAMAFGGAQQKVDIGDFPDFEIAEDMSKTMEVWFNAAGATGENQNLFSKEGSCRGWDLYLTGTGHAVGRFTTFDCGNNNYDLTDSSQSFADGMWHYMALVVDRSDKSADLYLDGTLRTSMEIDNIWDATASSVARLGNTYNYGAPLVGQLDEVRIQTVARSASWVAAQYASMTNKLVSYGTIETL